MNAVTIRRLLVFGVCALGVSALYLAPSGARSSSYIGGPRPDDRPTTRPTPAAPETVTVTTIVTSPGEPAPSTTVPRASDGQDAEQQTSGRTDRPRRVGTPFDPADGADRIPPAPVSDIVSATVTADRLSLLWPAATDNVGVVGYRIWLNGFDVATTTETSVSVRWFNDDRRAHVVQVHALDAAGNASTSSPNLLVTRPTPSPSPSPTSPASGSPVPSLTGGPTADPTAPGDPEPTSEPQPSAHSIAPRLPEATASEGGQ